MVLGPGLSLITCATLGAVVGLMVRPGWLASLLALSLPLLEVAYGLYRLWSTPAIFSFAHTVGYAPGTIYDEGLRIPEAYWSFRAFTIALLFGIFALSRALVEEQSLRLRWSQALHRSGYLAMALLLIGGATIAHTHAAELGFASAPEAIRGALGGEHRSERCHLYYPREVTQAEIGRLGQECDFQVSRLEHFMEVTESAPIDVYLFRDTDEKQRLMGAGRTYIAKPWRGEVYLQRQAWPHPVLAHELAHIVARNAAEGPLSIPGSWGGVVPNPGLIEGIAVAAAWDIREEMTPHEWSRAMLDASLLPRAEALLSLDFGFLPARRAYSAAGSFIRWIHQEYGAQTVKDAYRTNDLAASAGGSIADLDAAWRAWLEDEIELTDSVRERVRVTMRRRSIFSAVCPHRIADLQVQLAQDVAARDDGQTRETCEETLRIDPTQLQARAQLVGAYARLGEDSLAGHEFETLRDEMQAPDAILTFAEEAIADAHWRSGQYESAREVYVRLLESQISDAHGRRLEVKRLALESGQPTRESVYALLVENGPTYSPAVAVALALELDAQREDGLGGYLAARQSFSARDFRLSARQLSRSIARGLPTARIDREARRLYAISLFALERWDDAAAVFRAQLETNTAPPAQRHQSQLWLDRITHARGQSALSSRHPRSAQ